MDKVKLYKFLLTLSLCSDMYEELYKELIESEITALKVANKIKYESKYNEAVKKYCNDYKKQEKYCNKIAAERTRELKKGIAEIKKVYTQMLEIMRKIEKGFTSNDSNFIKTGKEYLQKYIDDNIKIID